MNQLDLGNPANGTPQFALPMPDRAGGSVVIFNETPYGLDFTIATSKFRVPADSWRQITITGQVSQLVTWAIANATNPSVASVIDVVLECYGLNECPNTTVGQIGRQVNVGNGVPLGATATEVVNDGSGGTTQVVEATPSGAGGSQLIWRANGSGVFGGGNASVDATGVFTLPASAVPVASIGAGALPGGVTLPGSQVTGGLPASSITGTLPAAQVGSGYPGSSVSGTVGSATTAGGLTVLTADVEAGLVVLRPSPTTDPVIVQTNDGVNSHNYELGTDGTFASPGAIKAATQFLGSAGGSFSGLHAISGSGSATVNHGLTQTPDAALVNNADGSNSTTMGSGSYTSSTVFIYQFTAMAWVGMVYKA